MFKRLQDLVVNLFDFFRNYDEFAAADAESESHHLHAS